MQASGASSVSSRLSRKEKFALLVSAMGQVFSKSHFYEFFVIANRYLSSGGYLSKQKLDAVAQAIRQENSECFFELFLDCLREVYQQDRELFYSIVGYLFQLGNDTYLLETFLELEVDRPLARLIQLLQDWPSFNTLTEIYVPYLQPDVFHQLVAGLRRRGVFAVPDEPSAENLAKCVVVIFYYTNVVLWPNGDELVPLPFEKFLKTIFGGEHNGNESESPERCVESDTS